MSSYFKDIYDYLLNHKKIPKWVAWMYISIFFVLIIWIGIFAGFSALDATGVLGASFCWLISVVFSLLWIYQTLKIIKHKKSNQQD
jgi:FtsH-binding integral membrane protein